MQRNLLDTFPRFTSVVTFSKTVGCAPSFGWDFGALCWLSGLKLRGVASAQWGSPGSSGPGF